MFGEIKEVFTTSAPKPKPFFRDFYFTRVGRDHLTDPSYWNSGCQDAFGKRDCFYGKVIVVADGSSSAFESKTGSCAAVRLVLNIAEEMLEMDPLPKPEEFAAKLQEELLKRLRASLLPFAGPDGDITAMVEQAYYFTLLIGVVTADWSAVMACGDGFYAINGKIEKIDSREGNYPDYLGYLLCNPIPEGFERVKIEVREVIPTDQLKSIFVASDGIGPVVKKRTNREFSISEVWENSLATSESVAAKLAAFAKDGMELSVIKTGNRAEIEPRLTRGIFGDDVTYVCLVVDPVGEFPEYWAEYRKRHSLSLVRSSFKAPVPVYTGTPKKVQAGTSAQLPPIVGDKKAQKTLPPINQNKSAWEKFGDFINRILFGKDDE
ncbi:MAG TPA: protein phosphatase 2C domain-containing protein [Oligoflexia bacterium]|nr:protein phosphatase 2C domain-containing protein [Oligoflexia bacterium]HMP47514.1 protein phosphatase 2C domain-containing protein [Oligoflexia bacterium]